MPSKLADSNAFSWSNITYQLMRLINIGQSLLHKVDTVAHNPIDDADWTLQHVYGRRYGNGGRTDHILHVLYVPTHPMQLNTDTITLKSAMDFGIGAFPKMCKLANAMS